MMGGLSKEKRQEFMKEFDRSIDGLLARDVRTIHDDMALDAAFSSYKALAREHHSKDPKKTQEDAP
jgi:hypothetical protein